jgi:predicted nucleic acid-binding protein
MYADTDFILGLIKEKDWLKEASEKVYRQHEDEIWTSRYVMIEILMVAYREGWNCEEILANVEELIEVRDNVEKVFQASVLVEENNITPVDALNIIKSGEDAIISSDQVYDQHSERVKLENTE